MKPEYTSNLENHIKRIKPKFKEMDKNREISLFDKNINLLISYDKPKAKKRAYSELYTKQSNINLDNINQVNKNSPFKNVNVNNQVEINKKYEKLNNIQYVNITDNEYYEDSDKTNIKTRKISKESYFFDEKIKQDIDNFQLSSVESSLKCYLKKKSKEIYSENDYNLVKGKEEFNKEKKEKRRSFFFCCF